MAATDLRQQVKKYVELADDKLLMAIKLLVENYSNDEVVAFSVKGEPLTKSQIIQELKEAETDYEKGDFTPHGRVKEEMKSWKK